MTAIALTIAGSDSSGGAGIQADLKAFSALGVYGASVITAVTAQNTQAVTIVHEIPTDVIRAQIAAVLDDLDVRAIKIGMLSSPEIIETVADALAAVEAPIVLDPVMVAKSGDRLLRRDAVAALTRRLIPMAALVTPNVPEAAILAEEESAADRFGMLECARALHALGAGSVLMKGGHLDGETCVDILATDASRSLGSHRRFDAPRIDTRNTHGTGCTLSAAVAAGLAKDLALEEAVAEAHAYVHRAIMAADSLSVGSGHGPVHHFHGMSPWKG